MNRLLIRIAAIVCTYIVIATSATGYGQTDSTDNNLKLRKAANIGFQSTVGIGSLAGLNFAWYANYPQSPFHLFNDWKGWMQMDKVGHATTAYQIGKNLYELNKWSGFSENSSLIAATLVGFGYQTAIEVLDGRSAQWGFSLSDFGFNTGGSLLFFGQQALWKEQRIALKFSYQPSNYTNMKPLEASRARNLYGSSITEQWLKDYNGQTYWLSANIWSLAGKPDQFPKWLNIAIGYSLEGVYGAESNSWTLEDGTYYTSSQVRQRQLLLSLDVDLEKADLPKPLRWIQPVFGLIKIPFPALEWNSVYGLRGHWMYF